MFNVVLGSVLDVSLLLANARQNDGFWWHAVLQHQAHFSLENKKTGVLQIIAKGVKAPLKQPKNVPKVLRNLKVQQSLADYQSIKCL